MGDSVQMHFITKLQGPVVTDNRVEMAKGHPAEVNNTAHLPSPAGLHSQLFLWLPNR